MQDLGKRKVKKRYSRVLGMSELITVTKLFILRKKIVGVNKIG